jgi:hypothetical protein
MAHVSKRNVVKFMGRVSAGVAPWRRNHFALKPGGWEARSGEPLTLLIRAGVAGGNGFGGLIPWVTRLHDNTDGMRFLFKRQPNGVLNGEA